MAVTLAWIESSFSEVESHATTVVRVEAETNATPEKFLAACLNMVVGMILRIE
jgi:hypothetical protein